MDQIVRERQPVVSAEETHPIVIIGCGFGGMAVAIELKKRGTHDFVILERAGEVGGTWRDNTYPGAACDIVSRLYSFSFDQKYDWSDAFAPQKEIWDYQLKVVERHGIRPHVRFNTEVASARFDDKTGYWSIVTTAGARFRTPVLISAVGLFSSAHIPDVPGRDEFKGVSFHSSNWNHQFPLKGKNVAVIGCGASAVQFVPRIAPLVAKLDLYQRSPQYVLPKKIFPGASGFDAWLQKRRWLRPLARLKVYLTFELYGLRRRSERRRAKGQARFREFLERKVKDAELRRKLTPNYPMGCKRQLVSDVWYDTLTRPNVEVIDTPIARITPDGLVTRDGTERKVDAIIYGTGFTTTAYLTPMKIAGLGSRDLNETWRDGAEAYLGITVTGFPNFFMMYGPNTNGPSSVIFLLECQARYIVNAIRLLRRKRARFMNVRADRQRDFNAEIHDRLSTTVWARADCHTYFKMENGKVTTNYPGVGTEYFWRTRRVRASDFEFVGVV